MPAKGNAIASRSAPLLEARELGGFVETVIVTAESPLPDGTCVGLNEQVVNAGRPEQVKVTLPGKVAVVGETSKV